MSGIKVFWLEPVNRFAHEIRRYAKSDEPCSAKPYGMSCHDARVSLGVVSADEYPASYSPEANEDAADAWKTGRITREDLRWPTVCACGYAFTADDYWQVHYEKLYEARNGPRDGETFTLRNAPVGAMWDAVWYREGFGEPWTGPDGLCLVVKTPGGGWAVDQECSNCTRTQWKPVERGKQWSGRTHYCWVRHGDPRTGNVHVDKNGNTCAAGAGSIIAGGWHGFLHNGYLVPC